MSNLLASIQNATTFIQSMTNVQPLVGVILGTGLGAFSDEIDVITEISYEDIPHFPVSTVKSHRGKLIFGAIEGVQIVCMAGRFHYYEGYTMQQVTFPVRVMHALGIQQLFITNVSGSTNPLYEPGDIVFLKDHINLLPENPLRGENDERLGPRFPDMKKTYNLEMNRKGLQLAAIHKINAHEGVYVALQGPNLETPAEYNFVHIIGGDLVGMSTVPEVLVAKHSSIDVTAISIVSNKCYPITAIKETSLEDVINIAEISSKKLTILIRELLKTLN
ncbi:MAG: purine-nucleoside phosphorylase [Saprospiraceae bacterium]